MASLTPGSVAAALLVAVFSATSAQAAAPAPRPSTLDGTYEMVAVHRDGARTGDDYRDVVVSHGRAVPVHLPAGRHLRGGTRVHLTGHSAGGVLAADTISVTGTPAPTTTTVSGAPKRRVLVILASWTQPDLVTQQSAHDQLFSDDDGWQSEVSYGAIGMTGDVTPWVSIAGPDGGLCYTNHRQEMDQAKAAALAAGYDAAAYDKTVLYFPHSANADCSGYGGWAYQPGTEVWINGNMDRRATVHELGHTDGLWHAASYLCTDAVGTPVVLASTGCSLNEYGDPSDAMGASSYVGHFSAVQKDRMGWLAGRTSALSLGSSATLGPLESATAPQVAASYRTATGRTYWFEYRTATGADASLPSGLDGLLVHLDDPAVSPRPLLLDMTPDGDFGNAALPAASRWVSPDGFVLTTGAADVAGLSVSVAPIPLDTTAPAPVTGLASSTSRTTLTLRWTPPVDKDYAGVVVRYALGSTPPASPTAGTALYSGTATSTTMTTAKGATYAFAVFARDAVPNYSRGAWLKQANKVSTGLL